MAFSSSISITTTRRASKWNYFFKFFLDIVSPVWNSMRTITPFHFTTDKFSANHTPLSKIFLKKKEAGQSVKAFDEVF